MNRTLHQLLFVWMLILAAGNMLSNGARADVPSPLSSDAIGKVYEKCAPVVVRLNGPGDTRSPARCGVIISPGGLIATSTFHIDSGQAVEIHLSDGRKVAGKTLGSSQEMAIGLLQITDPGAWPHVTLRDRVTIVAGDAAVVLGYPRNSDGTYDDKPTARIADVRFVSATGWAAADCQSAPMEYGAALFDLEGNWAGLQTNGVASQPCTFALAQVVEMHRAALQSGRSLDFDRIHSQEKLEAEKSTGKRLSQDEIRKEIGADAEAIAVKSTVKIEVSPEYTFSGVLVAESGLVATCAHTGQLPGQKVTVVLVDGRKVVGKVLGTNRIADIGMIQILEPGPWPFAKMGDSSLAGDGKPVIIVGYPAPNQGAPNREVALVSAVRPKLRYDPTMLFTSLDYQIFGGMSGGGVFDREGRLVAIHCGGGNPRIEMIKLQAKDLLSETEPQTFRTSTALAIANDIAKRCAQSAVVIEHEAKRVAMGTIIDKHGLVLTKSSLIGEHPNCKLPDGRLLPGDVIERWSQCDLALVRLPGVDDLVPVLWADAADKPVGSLVWAPIPDAAPMTGTIGHAARKLSAEPFWKGEGLADSKAGPAFDGRNQQLSPHLKRGDVVTSVDGKATATVTAVSQAAQRFAAEHVAGDPFLVSIIRDGAPAHLTIPFPAGTRPWFQENWESSRRSGFDAVATCDLALGASACGCPVFTLDGEFAGIGIASMVSSQAAMLVAMAQADNSARGKLLRDLNAAIPRHFSGAYFIPATAVKRALGEQGIVPPQ